MRESEGELLLSQESCTDTTLVEEVGPGMRVQNSLEDVLFDTYFAVP